MSPTELVFRSDGLALRLRSSVPLVVRGGDACAECVLRANESASFVLEEARASSSSTSQLVAFCERAFADTVGFWRRWLGNCACRGRWQDMINRSALLLWRLNTVSSTCTELPSSCFAT